MNYLRRENSTSAEWAAARRARMAAYKAESIAALQTQKEARAEALAETRTLKAKAAYRRQLAFEAELRAANAAARTSRNGGDATPAQLAESRRLGEAMVEMRHGFPPMKGSRAMESMRAGAAITTRA